MLAYSHTLFNFAVALILSLAREVRQRGLWVREAISLTSFNIELSRLLAKIQCVRYSYRQCRRCNLLVRVGAESAPFNTFSKSNHMYCEFSEWPTITQLPLLSRVPTLWPMCFPQSNSSYLFSIGRATFFPLTLKVPASLPPSSGGARVSIALTTPNENSAP